MLNIGGAKRKAATLGFSDRSAKRYKRTADDFLCSILDQKLQINDEMPTDTSESMLDYGEINKVLRDAHLKSRELRQAPAMEELSGAQGKPPPHDVAADRTRIEEEYNEINRWLRNLQFTS